MSTGFIPDFAIFKGGENITARFQDRAVSITVELAAGQGQQDSVDIILDDRDNMVRSPKVGQRLQVYLGYKDVGLAYMGDFEINSVRYSLVPALITVRGTAASSLNDIKTHKIQEFEGKTVEEILAEAGSKIGMKVKIHKDIADQKIPFLNQTMSFGHLVGKLEQQYSAVAKITDGQVIMVPRGSGKSVSDISMSTFVFRPEHFADLEALEDSKGATAKTVASFTDKTTNKRVDVEAKSTLSDVGTEAEHRLSQPFLDEATAKAAAEAVQAQLDRSTSKVFGTLSEGDPWVRDAQRILITGCRPGLDGAYLLEIVRHVFTKGSGIRTAFSGVGGSEGLPEAYADAGPTSRDFIAPKTGQVFGQLIPQLPGTELGQAFGSLPSFALNPPSIPTP